MTREAPLRHLRRHGCVLLREDGRHSGWAAEIAEKVGAMTPSDTWIRRLATLMLAPRARKEP